MKRKKYLMLRSEEEIAEIASEIQHKQSGKGGGKLGAKYIPDLRIEDNYFWISFDSMLRIFPMKLEFYFTDTALEAYNEIKKTTGLFPVREFETK